MHVCTRRQCYYTQEQIDYVIKQEEDFCEITCKICNKKKWACRSCVMLGNNTFAFVNLSRHTKTKYAHSEQPRPSGKRVPRTRNNALPRTSSRFQTELLPKMKPPREYLGKKREFHSTEMVHFVHGFIPTISPWTTNDIQRNDSFPDSYEGGESKPAKFKATEIESKLPEVWKGLANLKKGGLRVKAETKPYHVWKNKSEKEWKDTPIHSDRVTTLLIVVSGWGNKTVFVANSSGKSDMIQDGIGNAWKKDKSNPAGSEVWHPTDDSVDWHTLMPENIKAGAIIRKTLAVGDALLIPKGFLHGVLTYGDTTMLSISIDKI